jgi:hypothetical protein
MTKALIGELLKAMSYLIFPTAQDAVERSRLAWESVLSRKKHPEDVTEFLWGWQVGKDGETALAITEKEELLSSAERSRKTLTLDPLKFAPTEDETA